MSSSKPTLEAAIAANSVPPIPGMPEGSVSDLRCSRRYNYPATQYIARYSDGRMPEKSMFRAVRCFDLSSTGFSYLAPRPVERGKIVVALGAGLHFVYVAAEIVHCAPVGAGTALQFRVGCRFLERIDV